MLFPFLSPNKCSMDRQPLTQFIVQSNVVSHQQAAAIAEQFHFYSLEKNAFMLKAGRPSNEYVFLQSGFMRAFATDTEGNEVTTAFYAPGNVVFEVSSFFTRTISQENIQALTAIEGWCISYEELNRLFHTLPEFREFGRGILVKGFAALKARMLSMITETAEQRYQRLLQTSPEIFQAAPLKNIASYLGITDTSLSRIRKEFAKK